MSLDTYVTCPDGLETFGVTIFGLVGVTFE